MNRKISNEEWKEERIVYLLLAIFGAVLAIIFYFIPKDIRDIRETNLVTINYLFLTRSPEIRTYRSKERILLHVRGYVKPFQIAGFDFSNTAKRNIIREITAGDTIKVKIDSSEFYNINNKSFFDSYTEIHSLQKGGHEFLNISNRNGRAKNDFVLLAPVGILLLIAGLVYWQFPTTTVFRPSIVIGLSLMLVIIILKC